MRLPVREDASAGKWLADAEDDVGVVPDRVDVGKGGGQRGSIGVDPAVVGGQGGVGDDRWGHDRRHVHDQVGALAGGAELHTAGLHTRDLSTRLVIDVPFGQQHRHRGRHVGPCDGHRCGFGAANGDLDAVAYSPRS